MLVMCARCICHRDCAALAPCAAACFHVSAPYSNEAFITFDSQELFSCPSAATICSGVGVTRFNSKPSPGPASPPSSAHFHAASASTKIAGFVTGPSIISHAHEREPSMGGAISAAAHSLASCAFCFHSQPDQGIKEDVLTPKSFSGSCAIDSSTTNASNVALYGCLGPTPLPCIKASCCF